MGYSWLLRWVFKDNQELVENNTVRYKKPNYQKFQKQQKAWLTW